MTNELGSTQGIRRRSSILWAVRATMVCVRVTEADVSRIPATNLRVPRAEFTSLWIAAEGLSGADRLQR